MSALSINPPYPVFPDIDGQPLEDGYIWIGTAGMNPISNPIVVYWDAALTIPAPQPIRTIGGFPARAGSPAMLYVNSDYSIQVQNKNGSVTYSAPNATERYSDVVVSSVNAEDVIYDPPFTNAVQTNVEAKLAQAISVKDFGAVGDGVTNDTAAIQAAIDYANTLGAELYFPAGVYKHTSTLVWKNGVRYFGPNINLSNSLGAVLVYTGNDDANVINNTVNAGVFACIQIEYITFVCSSLATNKAMFYDTGSYYLNFNTCKFNFAGAGSFGLVFHQTGVSSISKCIFEATGNIGNGALIRLADGPVLKHPHAIPGYTNRITITENQINPALGGPQAIGLWDDGGVVHTIKDNNFNDGFICLYLIRPYPVEIMANQFEAYSGAAISAAFAGAGLTGLRIVGNYMLGVPPALSFANNSIAEMTYTDNVISVLGGGPCETNIAGSPAAKIFAANNREVSVGNNPYNNYLAPNVDTVGPMLLAGSGVAGTQTYTNNTMTWRTIGDVCFFNVYIALSAKDPATAGNVRITGLPFPARSANAQITSVTVSYISAITMSVNYTQLSAIIQPGNNYIELLESGSAQPVQFLTAAGISGSSQIIISGMYPI